MNLLKRIWSFYTDPKVELSLKLAFAVIGIAALVVASLFVASLFVVEGFAAWTLFMVGVVTVLLSGIKVTIYMEKRNREDHS